MFPLINWKIKWVETLSTKKFSPSPEDVQIIDIVLRHMSRGDLEAQISGLLKCSNPELGRSGKWSRNIYYIFNVLTVFRTVAYCHLCQHESYSCILLSWSLLYLGHCNVKFFGTRIAESARPFNSSIFYYGVCNNICAHKFIVRL